MIDRDTLKKVAGSGLWNQNTALVQALGLCPLLAVSTNAINGTTLALATILVMMVANIAVASLRNLIPYEIRIPVFILIIAALVTIVDLLFNAYLHGLYLVLGIFIPLIVTNCIVLARVEAFAAKNPPLVAAFDGVFMGVGLLWTLALLGALRELLGSGTLFAGASLLLGESFRFLELTVIPDYRGFLMMILPPGGFLALGFLIALQRVVEGRQMRRSAAAPAQLSAGSAR